MPSEELVRVRLQPSGAPWHSEVRVLGSIDEWQAYSQVRTTEDAVGFVEQELGERPVGLVLGKSECRRQVLDDRVRGVPGRLGRGSLVNLSTARKRPDKPYA